MKKIVVLFVHVFFISFFFATDYSLFKYTMNTEIDYFTGEFYGRISDNILCKEKIKFIEDKNKDLHKEYTQKRFYNENGQLERFESDVVNDNWYELTYNENG